MSKNPFDILKTTIQSNNTDNAQNDVNFNNLIEEIFLITIDKLPENNQRYKTKPKYLYFFGDSVDYLTFSLDNIENIILDRILLIVNKTNVLQFDSGYTINIDYVIDPNPINYLYNCFVRCLRLFTSCFRYSKNDIEVIKNAIIKQAYTYIRICFDSSKPVGADIYCCLADNSSESECLLFFSKLFVKIDTEICTQNDAITIDLLFQDFFQHFLTQTFFNSLPPHSNLLGIWKDPLQTLYCPERKKFCSIMSILSSIPLAAEMILDFSSSCERGIDFERCLLGRFLCSTHLPSGIMQSPEFFNKLAITIQDKRNEEQHIWQLTKTSQGDSCHIFMNIFQSSKERPEVKTKLINWFTQCIHLNRARNQLAHAMNSIPVANGGQLASDGFFMNLVAVLFHIADPLIKHPLEKILQVQLEFTEDKDKNESILPGLSEETRLIPMSESVRSQLELPSRYSVLTQLFYLVHKAFQLSFHVIQARFMELNQQIHRIQDVYEDLLRGGADGSEEGEHLKKMITNQMSQYLSLNSSMRQPEFMGSSFGLVAGACRLLVQIARAPSESREAQLIACVPEFVMDNIVDWLTFLRHFDDGFYETSGFGLESLLEMVVLYMGSPNRLKNPHLRSKVATLLECLIPQRDETPTQSMSSISFYLREQLFRDNASWTHDLIIEALFNAFTTMELSTGAENVRFEEKFEYRRPMYACMRYFYNKPRFDRQVRELERDALDNINNTEAPLCLKFLNLLINDATYLLDEALNYLGQLKTKEIERINQGGRYTNQTEEGNFQHMVMLAKYHNSLATDTIEQFRRMATLCPNIIIHPVLIDRIACTLNYFLDHLVGPKRSCLTVLDKEAYAFRPKQLVTLIAQIYVSLGDKPDFCSAVVNDGRSYSDRLLETAMSLMGKLSNDAELFSRFEELTKRLKICSANQNQQNENFEGAPEDFLDPIMGTLMTDPVTLPSSGINVDRKTIFRHLLSDPTDPFNRQPLTMSDVVPNDSLKMEILTWIEAHQSQS